LHILLAGAPATTPTVTLSQESSTSPGVILDRSDGSVLVAPGTPAATYTLVYKICESANPENCGTASVKVTVLPYATHAADDQGSISPSTAGSAVASVLANDTLGSAPATTANVSMSLVSLSPPTNDIRLDAADQSVDVRRRTQSGTYRLVYQICEIASPGNSGQGTVTPDLSGKRTVSISSDRGRLLQPA
jgi:large repetitive protein